MFCNLKALSSKTSALLIGSFLVVWSILLVPLYLMHYGWQNFFWFSDIGLFLTVSALFVYSPLLISMVCLAILPAELVWYSDFFFELFTKAPLFGVTTYMFDSALPLALRALSLFHLLLPPIWIFFLRVWGYDRRAFVYAIGMWISIIVCTYYLTDPSANINWVFAPRAYAWYDVSQPLWLIVLCICVPLAIFLPLHYLYIFLFTKLKKR